MKTTIKQINILEFIIEYLIDLDMRKLNSVIYILFVSIFLFAHPLVSFGQTGSGTQNDPYIVDSDGDGYHTFNDAYNIDPNTTVYYKLGHSCIIQRNSNSKNYSFNLKSGNVVFDLNGLELKLGAEDYSSYDQGYNRQLFIVSYGATLTIKSSKEGGAIVGKDGSTTDTDDWRYYSKNSCIYVYGNLEFESGTIKDFVRSYPYNGSVEPGGCAIFISQYATVNMKGGSIMNCGFDYGIYNEVANTSYDEDSRFIQYHNGGGVYVADGGTLNLSGGEISGCKAYKGGGVYVADGGVFTMSGGKISNSGFNLDLFEAFTDPNLNPHSGGYEQYGGGVYVGANGKFSFSNGRIEGCKAYEGGGVFVVAGDSNDKGLYLSGDLSKNENAVITNCTAAHFGGGVYVKSSTAEGKFGFTMTGGDISYCRASIYGCGAYLGGTATMTGGEIHHNYPYRQSLEWDEYPKTVLFEHRNDLANNKEPYDFIYPNGGGVCLENANFTITGGNIKDNVASSGGAVMVQSNSVFTLNNSTGELSSNWAIGNLGTGNGGAVYVNNGCTFNFEDGKLNKNLARRYGGAVNINASSFLNLNGNCEIKNNQAGHGGGLSQEAGECRITLENDNVIVSENSAIGAYLQDVKDGPWVYGEGNGGGIFIEKGSLDISAGKILKNSANGSGGGIALRSERLDGVITLNLSGSALIQGNVANANDGDIADDSDIISGDGGGIDIYGKPADGKTTTITANLDGGTIVGNSAYNGGGIKVYVYKPGDTGSESTATNVASVNISKAVVIDNSAVRGGGIAVTNGNVEISDENGKIENNTAVERGGGLYVFAESNTDNQTKIVFSGGNIINNRSADGLGGGICVDGNIELTTTGTNVKHNRAKNGGGIYLLNSAKMLFNGGIISNNVAQGSVGEGYTTAFSNDANNSGVGGGVYLAEGTQLSFFAEGTDGIEKFGLYGNVADVAADDIFASGKGNTITLPNVSSMSLDGFDAPTSDLFWVEDYVTKDSQYTEGTQIGKQEDEYVNNSEKIVRYRYALQNYKDINIITFADENEAHKDITSYVCLALGYEQFFVNLVKKGLVGDDSAIFKVSYKKDNDYVPYRTILFNNNGGEEARASVVLTAGNWKFEEDTHWSGGKYTLTGVETNFSDLFTTDNPFSYTKNSSSFSVNINSRIYETLKDKGMNRFEFTITNEPKTNTPPQAEGVKINKMIPAVTL